MKAEPKPLKNETATQAFKREVAELRPRLPKDWKIRFLARHREYDSYRGGLILHNVINGQSSDPVVLAGIREIVTEFEKEKGGE
jgi:hypothetical protein